MLSYTKNWSLHSIVEMTDQAEINTLHSEADAYIYVFIHFGAYFVFILEGFPLSI